MVSETRIDLTVPTDLLDEFRTMVGPKKGSLKKGIIEAINMWIQYKETNTTKILIGK